ncbi:hypothetical protein GBA63_17915 [Rubrobacter tropicus]|uniref:Uncharacterized protein n=1 Tax=Rubrobacter tropicus TaxID=2653851 RepID=A0A6G8QCS4_9ACTN|nr:hypothetical protein [Rubrobacter tropicus]QIN84314.1 hypothetical protein GBA63_17915 [Rubrobacter tropicus]
MNREVEEGYGSMLEFEMNRAAERLARANQESLRALAGGALAVQRQNAKLYQDWTEISSAMVEESVRMCVALSWAPFYYASGSGPRGADGGDEKGRDLPVADYDQLDVEEVVRRLEGLTAREVEKLEEYEKHHKNRPVLVERMDRCLV